MPSWPAQGTPYALTNFRGEEKTINARGLYYWDTLSSALQAQANDLVALVLGLPLLRISFWLAWRGCFRARLILTGTLGFILYTYMLASVGLLKFLTMGTAVSLMGLNMARVGIPVSAVELAVFPTISLVNIVMVIVLLRNVTEQV